MTRARTWLPAAVWPLWLACAAPPAPAAEHAQKPPQAAAPRPARCGLVRRAERTWVGFADGMTPDDMFPAGMATSEIVHALDAAICALQRGEKAPALRAESTRLRDCAANGGRFEITKVLWQDVALTHAHVELHAGSSSWMANVVRREEQWRIATFSGQ